MKTIPFGWFAAQDKENRQEIIFEQGVAISMTVIEKTGGTSVFFLVFIFTR